MAFVENLISAPDQPAGGGGANGRQFDFAADTFVFANELVWEYRANPVSGQMTFHRRETKPTYAHRCFVVVRAARQFFFHAWFDAAQKPVEPPEYRQLIRAIVRRSPRQRSTAPERIIIPGFANLRALSLAHPEWLKAECGAAWQSYILRSHWRMVLPISLKHQKTTAENLVNRARQNAAPIIHLVKFPALTINHGMIVYDVSSTNDGFLFTAYDPNDPSKPVSLTFDVSKGTFYLPANSYWAGGDLRIIEIYRSWWM